MPKSQISWPVRVLLVIALYFGGLTVSSLLAGTATAPIAAFHFNRTAPYGLLANLMALPVMGFWIAPCACIAAILAPLGLAGPVLQLMGAGIEQILMTAHWIAELPGAVRPVQTAPQSVLAMMALGGLWLAIWRGWWRFAGVAPMIAALVIWSDPPRRPDVLIADQARLIGVMGAEGRVLDHERAQSFAAKSWLRRDGDLADQALAAARPGLTREKGELRADLPGKWTAIVYWGKQADRADALCTDRTILVSKRVDPGGGPCIAIGPQRLKRSGSLAISIRGETPEIRQSRDPDRQRLWSARQWR